MESLRMVQHKDIYGNPIGWSFFALKLLSFQRRV